MATIKSIFKKILFLIGMLIILLALFLIYISLNDFQPPDSKSLLVDIKNPSQIEFDSSFSLMSWNLGYNGLGKEMDFFYDEGKQVRANEKLSSHYLEQNLNLVKSRSDIHFWFFQEVDQHSKRSYFINQENELTESLSNYNSVFAKNYAVKWVPVPLLNPMGKVNAGLMTFSKNSPIEALRISYPNIAAWPNNLFLLDRCFILSRYLLPNNKHLVLMNTHNSYYVSNDSLRKVELEIIRQKMLEEYKAGNYIVAGGDWNRLPANFHEDFKGQMKQLQKSVPVFENDFLPKNWLWAYDTTLFTNRELNFPYDEKMSQKSSIDYFIVSPNVEIVENYVFPLNFENSDHNPVFLKFKIKNSINQKTNQL